MKYKEILYEITDNILILTFNRPDHLNIATPVMATEFMDAINRADADDDVRVIIVTGAGKGFCAGADLSHGDDSFVVGTKDDLETHRDMAGIMTLRIYDLRKPIIAAINGPAVGIGITLTLPMDIRIASEKARMGFVFSRRGIVPDGASSWFLPRIVGISTAVEWAMSGRIFDAQEALRRGLVSEVIASDALMPRAIEIASDIARNTSAISVALTRQLFWKMLGADHPMEGHKLDSKCVFWASKHADVHEGVRSFVEKRPPKFTLKPSKDMPEFYPWWTDRPFRQKGRAGRQH